MTDAQTAVAQAQAGVQALADLLAANDLARTQLSLSLDTATAANIALQAQLDTANATIASLTAKLADQRTNIIADSSGTVDVTTAIQGQLKGKTFLPAGRYLVSVQSGYAALKLPDGLDLLMDPKAVLVIKPNALPRHYLLWADNAKVVIEGGQLLGDRLQHDYSSGGTHEHGYGLKVTGNSVVKAKNVKATMFTGDGFCGSGNVTLENCVSQFNRRQGVSATSGTLTVIGGEYSGTGDYKDAAGVVINAGTKPMAGIDLEPDNPDTSQVVNARISGAKVTGNQGAGIESHRGVLNTTIENSTVTGNGTGMVIVGSQGGSITGCTVDGRWGTVRFGTDGVAAMGWTVVGVPKVSVGTGCQVTVK